MALVQINLKALRQNYQSLKALAPHSHTLGVIKAEAYGHGLLEVARTLKDADMLAVARLEEALHLREADIQTPVLLLDGVLSLSELRAAQSHQFKIVIHNEEQVSWLEALDKHKVLALTVWIKVNTGMNRLGFRVEQLASVCERLRKLYWLNQECLMTHFANADSGKAQDIETALHIFEQAKKICSHITQYSVCNSAALFAYPQTHGHWNRPGITLYGCSTLTEKPKGLLPVMRFSAPVIAVNQVKKGEAVGYGATWKAKKNTHIAVVAVGYGDGYPRHAKNGTPVEIAGKLFSLAGRVSMDMITVDIGNNAEQIAVGDQAILWGSELLSADTVAEWSDTISYELFCKLGKRVRREYLNG